MVNTAITRERKVKSVDLKPSEIKRVQSFVDSYRYKIDALLAIGISNNTLDRLIGLGTCSMETKVKLDRVVFKKRAA